MVTEDQAGIVAHETQLIGAIEVRTYRHRSGTVSLVIETGATEYRLALPRGAARKIAAQLERIEPATPATPGPEARIAAAYREYTNPKETTMPRTHALQIVQTLDDYLDARDKWEDERNTGPIVESIRRLLGDARTELVDVLTEAMPDTE